MCGVTEMSLDSTPAPRLWVTVFINILLSLGSENDVKNNSGYSVLWNYGGRRLVGEQVGKEARLRYHPLPPLLHLTLLSSWWKHLISHFLVVIFMGHALGPTMSTSVVKLQFDSRQIIVPLEHLFASLWSKEASLAASKEFKAEEGENVHRMF